MEAEARPFSPLLREIFDRMPAGVAVFDRDLRIVEWNTSFQRFLADNRPDLVERLKPGAAIADVSPWPVDEVDELFAQALRGNPVARDAAPYTGPMGTTYWDIVLSPLYEDGEIVGVLDTTTEATRRVVVAREAAEREELFRLVFESTNDAVILNDFETGFVADCNPAAARMHGYTRDEFLGIDPAKFIHPSSLPLLAEYQESVRQGQDFHCQAIDIRKDGTVFDVDVMGTGFEYRGKKYLAAVVRDISDQVEAERERRKTQQALVESQALLELRVDERTRELSSLLDVSRAVLSTLDLDLVFDRVMDEVAKVLRYSGCSVSILDGDNLEIVATRNRVQPELEPRTLGLRFKVKEAGPIWERMLEGSPFILPDLFEDTIESRAYRTLVGNPEVNFPQTRSWLSVPMINQGEVIGVLSVSRVEPDAFSRTNAELAAAFAGQVAVAVANARLFYQAQRRAREMEGLAGIAAALTFEMAADDVLNTLSARVVASSSAIAASISLYDAAGGYRRYGASGLPPGFVDAMVEEITRRGAPSVTARAFLEGERRVLFDTRQRTLDDPRFALAHPYLRDAEWDNAVITPIISRGRNLGTLDTYFRREDHPDAEELRLLSAIADQVAVGLENIELVDQLRRRVHELDTVHNAHERFHESLMLDEVLEALAASAVDVIGAGCGVALIFDEAPPHEIRVGGAAGLSDEQVAELQASFRGWDTSFVRTVLAAHVVEDTSSEPDDLREITGAAGVAAVIDVPIMIGGRSFGIFAVGWPEPRRIQNDEVRLASVLAQQAAVAIENARLYQRAQVAASLEERQRLARELHDSVSQALYGISLGARTARALVERDPARAIEPLDYVGTLAEAGLAELRALIFELRPESLAMEGLVAALEKQFAALHARHGITVAPDLCLEPDLRLDLKEVLYRVGQEALHNTVKHARASHVTVRLTVQLGQVELEVADNGIGFDTSGEFPGHLGLRSMAERTARAGGALDIESAPGTGTRIRVSVPATPGHLPGEAQADR